MDAVAVVPIQAITCCIYVTTALASMLLFLEGFAVLAFLTASIVCHAWRIYSESLRADHRGGGEISKYQLMAAAGMVYAAVVALYLEEPAIQPDVSHGLRLLWDPFVILFHQLAWCVLFLFHGRSMVTGSEISIHLRRDRI